MKDFSRVLFSSSQTNTTDGTSSEQHQIDAIDTLMFVAILIAGIFVSNLIQSKNYQQYLPESGTIAYLYDIDKSSIFDFALLIEITFGRSMEFYSSLEFRV
jgi:hypothetical protein